MMLLKLKKEMKKKTKSEKKVVTGAAKVKDKKADKNDSRKLMKKYK